MCREALPKHIDEASEWAGTDHDTWWMRWFIPLKLKYCVFGPRDSHKWHKWREWPLCVFFLRGEGYTRLEDDKRDKRSTKKKLVMEQSSEAKGYVSRIQKWCKWHVQLQWPLFFACHINIKGKPLYFYLGAHRDADKVYWIPSAYIGLKWK